MGYPRNKPCPCGSGRKFKKCCLGEVDWEDLLSRSDDTAVRHMTTRGKNLLFLGNLHSTLGVDQLTRSSTWADVKRAVTPDTVLALHELVVSIWPDGDDLQRVLDQESNERTGLYVGTYESIERGLVRHSLYADRILVVDPFMHPRLIRDEYNPLSHPELHITNTIKALLVWWRLAPWIEADIVRLVRVPGDFDPLLTLKTFEVSRDRYESNPDLASALDRSTEQHLENGMLREMKEYHLLSMPDEQILGAMDEGGASEEEAQDYLSRIHKRREEHPFFIDVEGQGQGQELLTFSTGTNYEMAKQTARLSGSHIITDLDSRWREIEIDHSTAGIDAGRWSPFAKAVQNLEFNHLEEVGLREALKLRKEGRLESMRSFFRRVWRSMADENEFDDANTEELAAELIELVNEAEAEWRTIDERLAKLSTTESLGALGVAIATGQAQFAAGSFVASQLVNLGISGSRRWRFKKTYPAAFFLGK